MRRTKSLLAVLALSASTSAAAQETGIYLGLAAGPASYREACRDFDQLAGAPGTFNCMSKEDTAVKVFGGWRFHRNFAAEVSYIDYGEAKETGSLAGAPVPASTKAKAAGVAALGILPLAGRFSDIGKVGLLEVRNRTTVGDTVAEDKEVEVHTGIGGLYEFGRGWGIRAEYERVNDTKIDLFSFGVQYLF